MKKLRVVPALLVVSLLGAPRAIVSARSAAPTSSATTASFYEGIGDPESFERVMNGRLATAQQILDRLTATKGPRTFDNTLRPFDELSSVIASVVNPSGLIASVHPDERMRNLAESFVQRGRSFSADVAVNRVVYDALAALDLSGADGETKQYVERELRDYRLAGVDKDDATRARVKQLRAELATAVQAFQRNLRDDNRQIVVKDASELAGLPADFVARHKPDENGAITIKTDDADVRPILTFARNEDVRKRLYMEWTNVGYPANIDVLQKMITLRADIAHQLGFENWAAYDTADRMSGSAKAASDFIDRVVDASAAKAAQDYEELLKRKQQDVPGATVVNAWENTYYSELVRRAQYSFDAQSVRPYFQFDRVRQGIFDVTSKMYGVTYRPAKDVPVWHPSVDVYEMLENGTLIGRFYLDMHPRPNHPNNGASTATVRIGIAGRQTPEAVLVAGMAGGEAGDPGLLTHPDVVTFFHEFGHLVHNMVAGRHQWMGVARVTDRDFIEAPSQMFEEWAWDPATLATFARHYQTNEPIAPSLVAQMRRANEFGKGLNVRQQMVLARLALSLHDRDPKSVDSTELLKEITKKYLPIPFVEGAHRQTAFTHLANGNYSSSYYTYMWSLVIAKDLFSRFDPNNLLSPESGRQYRAKVLAPGGSKPPSALMQDFLGRPFNATAWERWLNRDPS